MLDIKVIKIGSKDILQVLSEPIVKNDDLVIVVVNLSNNIITVENFDDMIIYRG